MESWLAVAEVSTFEHVSCRQGRDKGPHHPKTPCTLHLAPCTLHLAPSTVLDPTNALEYCSTATPDDLIQRAASSIPHACPYKSITGPVMGAEPRGTFSRSS